MTVLGRKLQRRDKKERILPIFQFAVADQSFIREAVARTGRICYGSKITEPQSDSLSDYSYLQDDKTINSLKVSWRAVLIIGAVYN